MWPMPRAAAPWHAAPMSAAQRKTTLHLLYTRPGEAAVHTLTTDQTTYYGANVPGLARAAGLGAVPLRRVHYQGLGAQDGVLRAEVVWHYGGGEGELHWRPLDTLDERERIWVDLALCPPPNVPWMHAGWWEGALAWVDDELREQGLERTGEPEVLKHWQISALWRVPTVAGPVYFKAVPDFLAREVEVSPRLAAELLGAAPRVLAADAGRGFLLLQGAGEVRETHDLPVLMAHLADIQRASVGLLPALGLRNRGPEYVRGWLDTLLADETLMVGHRDDLTADEANALRAQRGELEAALNRLAASPLPRTLGHGDLHGGNVAVQDGLYTILDWSDVCETHPFMDANPSYFLPDPFQSGDHSTEAGTAADQTAAEDAYLARWADVAPAHELRPLLADGQRAGELLRALGYVDGIQPAVHDKREWSGTHLYHLRKLL